MTEDRFKFIKEINSSQLDKENQQYQQDSKQGKLVFCHFSNVKEQTPNEEGKPFKFHNDTISQYQTNSRDQRCYFKDNILKIYSRGGSEFIVPIHLNVANIFPIEDGIIIKVEHNKDMLLFEHQNHQQLRNSKILHPYSYFTLTNHPLDDIYPLSFQGEKDLIETHIDIFHVSYKLPIVVLFNKQNQQLSFGLLKQKKENDVKNLINDHENEDYIQSIEPESRNPELYNISKNYQFYIDEIFTTSCQAIPDKIYIQQSLTNSYEIVFAMFFNSIQKLVFYTTDIRNIKEFKIAKTIDNILDISQIQFSRQKQGQCDSIKIISKTLRNQLDRQEDQFMNYQQSSLNQDLRFLKKRIQLFTKDIIILDQQGRNLTFYQGYTPILTIDILNQLESQFLQQRQSQFPKTLKIESLVNPNKNLLTLNFNNGQNKRISFQFQITDFLVQSILKTFKVFLPNQVYESLTQDLIETLSQSINDQSKTNDYGDQFQKFSNMLISIITCDTTKQSQIQSEQKQQQQQQQQQTQKPATTLQTKILRSSTTSFAGDQLNKKKSISTSQSQQPQIQQQQTQKQTQIRSSIVSTNSLQQRRVASGSSEIQPLSTTVGGNSQLSQISSNPFADLLNSDFHKESFGSQYAGFFNPDIKFQTNVIQQQADQIMNQSQTSPSKGNYSAGKSSVIQPQKITSQKQSQPIPTNERRGSNILPQPQKQTVISYMRTQKQDLVSQLENIFIVLHLLYEDLKLNKLRDPIESPKLARLLIKLIFANEPLKRSAFLDYYIKENPQLNSEFENDIKNIFKGDSIVQQGTLIQPVPKIYKWLESCLRKSNTTINYPFPLFFEKTRKICRIYEILSNSQSLAVFSQLLINKNVISNIKGLNAIEGILNKDQVQQSDWLKSYSNRKEYQMQGQLSGLHMFEKVLFCLKEENMSLEEVKKLPSIISLPILEIIRYARLFQQEIQSIPKWPDSLYKLIQREDILNNLRLFERGNSSSVNKKYQLQQFQKQGSKRFALNRGMSNVFKDDLQDEQKQQQSRKEMESNILKTAADLIETKSDQNNPQSQNSNLNEFLKNRFNQDTRYKEVCNILNSSSEMIIKLEHIKEHETLSEDKLHSEKQALLDRLFLRQLSKCTGRGALIFGTMQTIPTETLHIPKINQTGFVSQSETYMQVEFKDDANKDLLLQWPDFHNGVASALRIAQTLKNRGGQNSSHTRNWIMYHKPSEPKYEHGGFLLAIGLLGQLDTLQPTDIYQHLKSTHDATAIGILLGRAASKIGTMDDHDTRTLCIHIPYLLPPTLSIDISLSIQSAAVIGAGLLYKGTSNRLMTEMLLAQIGRKPLSDKAIEREGYALASGIALGLVNLGIGGTQMQGISDLKLNERLIRFVEGGKTIDLPQSMLSANFNHDNTKQCSAIKEGDMVNVHITSPGGLIALALIHLKSNNEQISGKLQMPQTFYSLEYVRPSFLLQKVLCKNLIMWDSIVSSKEWVLSQIPTLIRDIYENDISIVEKKFSQQISEDEIDYSTVALCYVNIVAGAIFALGFKYAGTGRKEVFNLVQEFTSFFRNLRIVQSNKDNIGVVHNNITKNQIDKITVETCLCVSAFSMSLIMAGTGDIECFRTLRVLRKRFEHEMHYGFNMAIHMSLGFLFLGSGAFTFSNNNLAIAALLCSLYPVFPSNPSDNRYHLQALRHFYVLAIETRLLQARDIDSGEFVNIQVDVELEGQDSTDEKRDLKVTTPAIINGKIKKIEIKNEQFHYICLQMQEKGEMMDIDTGISTLKKQKIFDQRNLQQIIYVKKRAYYETQQENVVQTTQTDAGDNLKDLMELEHQSLKDLAFDSDKLIEKVSQIQDPSINAFYKNFAQFQNQIDDFPEIEDVLLAQSRDPYSQLRAQEFFRIEDLYQQVKEYLSNQYISESIKQKLRTLKILYESYKQDKLEAASILLDQTQQSSRITLQMINEERLLRAYQEFIKSSTYIQLQNKEESIINQQSQNSMFQQVKQESNKQFYQNYIKTLGENTLLSQVSQNERIKFEINNILDPHEIQLAKIVLDQILNELRAQGETELVDQYIRQKSNNCEMQDGPLKEINESIRLSLQQMFAQDFNMVNFIDQMLIPGCLNIGKQ